ncbi:hypothetical protein [Actinoalloteichus sp. GBA129-24]|uniref:hypothetical protein n=1 Tax=Actinoalloteichus sp. GBA129-24 TaxID=1612551 RepID=UPI0009507938|nr:hypothetical protein [Actinoalloteichus sp. GBA129-24]APU20947.1 hypothetical protein UA75_14685 [Actinoalloteichus sp. GBA129-24]APU24196.1 hypothetical protein UA75_31165 [Actinoalloteichus sp. GBA129-24]
MPGRMRITVYPEQSRREAYRSSTPPRRTIAEAVVAGGRSDAPVLTGEYRDGMGVRQEGDRVFAEDTDDEAIYKEYGTSDTPAHASLTDSARRFGRYTGWTPR